MKRIILFLFLAVSLVFVSAAPSEWYPPEYDQLTEIKSVNAETIAIQSIVSPSKHDYISIRSGDDLRVITRSAIVTTIYKVKYLTFSEFDKYNRWRYVSRKENLPLYNSDQRYLQSTIYNASRLWQDLV